MDPGSPLLALRFGGQCHALEPGRTYLIGSAPECDLRISDAAPHHACLQVGAGTATIRDLNSRAGVLCNEHKVTEAAVAIGDRIAVSDELMVLVEDDGSATLVPIPELRQAAFTRRVAPVRQAAAMLRRSEDHTFAAMTARELRRAPWLLASLLLHLLLLAFFWLEPTPKNSGLSIATIGFDLAAGAPKGDGKPSIPEVETEEGEDVEFADPEPESPQATTPEFDGAEPVDAQPIENPILATRKRASNRGSGGNIVKDENDVGSGSFRKTVSDLQKTGLDIVFVFDSTGSMTRTIEDTKQTIAQMLDVLRDMVPQARVGLVTFRDRGRREDYLVRQVPLDVDYWRARNFMQFVVAAGGGDLPEDVRAGMLAALSQDWRHGARRVIVLAGDAPPHSEDSEQLVRDVRSFATDRRSFVHTLITNPDDAEEETKRQFERIAKAGQGCCERIEHGQRVLQRVLTMAIGPQFDEDIQLVIDRAEQRRDHVDTKSLHLAREGGKELQRALLQKPVPMELWNAVVRRPRREVAETLVTLLRRRTTPAHARHAAAAALQQILGLPVPPIDPETDDPPSRRRMAKLATIAKRLPD